MSCFKGFFLFALILGCTAIPTPKDDEDRSYYFIRGSGERIVGGVPAAFGGHPHMVALTTGLIIRTLICSGTIVGFRHILTAAHCLNPVFSGNSLTSSLRGTVGTTSWNSGGQSYSFSRNITHPDYNVGPIKNDLSILITSSTIQFNDFVKPIAVGSAYIGVGVEARVAGWGRTSQGGAISANLQEIVTRTVDAMQCAEVVAQTAADMNAVNPPVVDGHIELCTFADVNVGTCNMDSGGALVRLATNEIIGIISWGFPCAIGVPDMYVRVSVYRDWINHQIVFN